MTDKEKLEKIKVLADEMYYRMQNLSTDTSGIRKAMYDYHQFIINEYYKEEPVSNDLEEAAHLYVDTTIECFDSEGNPCCYPAFIAGAQWQKQQLIEKACEWLNNFYSEDRHCYFVKEDIDNFKKAMEEQL